MSLLSWLWLAGECAACLSVLLENALLLGCIIRATPRTLRGYALVLLLQMSAEVFSSLASTLTLTRIVPVSTSFIFIHHGPCIYVHRQVCFLLTAVSLTGFTYSFGLVAIMFAIRLYAMERQKPMSVSLIARVIAVAAAVTLLPTASLIIDQAPFDGLSAVIRRHRPGILEEDDVIITGFVSVTDSPRCIAYLGYLLLGATVLSAMIVISRRTILARLREMQGAAWANGVCRLTPQAQLAHRQFVRMLTIQFVLIALAVYGLACFAVEATDLLRSPLLESSIFIMLQVGYILSPLVTMFYVPSYRKEAARLLCGERKQKEDDSSKLRSTDFSQSTQSRDTNSSITQV